MYTAFERRKRADKPSPPDLPAPRASADGSTPLRLLRRLSARQWVALVLLILAGMLAWLVWALPVNRALAPLPNPTLVLLDSNGVAFARRGAYKDAPVDTRFLPPHVVDAVLSIEDRRFFHHPGIDPLGVARAALRNARAGAVKEGGSTITQQLAKTSFLSSDRTLRRKLQEAMIALWLEFRLDKHEILSRYLSSVYFGDGVYGLRAAARHYFDLAPEELGVAEAAMLAGMIKAPSALSPTEHPERARARAELVIRAMVDNGVLDEAEARALPPARLRGGRAELPVGTYFADWIAPKAKAAFAADYGEVPVHTTLDLGLQQHAERVIARAMRGAGSRGGATQVALVAMRPSGEIVAMVGGREYGSSPFNRATQAQRQPGSAFKLFVYHAAARSGVLPTDSILDTPLSVGSWTPANYDDRYRGRLSIRDAFAQSSNVAAVRLSQLVGSHAVLRSARDLGIRSKLGADGSLALGSYETNLLELTSAYAAIAAGAAPVIPFGIADHPPRSPQVAMDPAHRAVMLDLLWSAVQTGTARSARLSIPAFGKTGTTQDYRDALFVGMAGDLVTGVWVGNDDNAPMRGITGGSLPAVIWRDFMSGAGLDGGPDSVLMEGWQPPASGRRAPGYRERQPGSSFGKWWRKFKGKKNKNR